MSGMELYSCLKREHQGLVTKVMFTISDGFNGNVESFLGEVYRSMLPKPFTPDELMNIARDAVNQVSSDGPTVVVQSITR